MKGKMPRSQRKREMGQANQQVKSEWAQENEENGDNNCKLKAPDILKALLCMGLVSSSK